MEAKHGELTQFDCKIILNEICFGFSLEMAKLFNLKFAYNTHDETVHKRSNDPKIFVFMILFLSLFFFSIIEKKIT